MEHTSIIEQYFNSTAKFLSINSCVITKYGKGFDQITVKITLPELSDNIRYKSNITYDLIKNIKLDVDKSTLLNYTSDELRVIDLVTRDNANFHKLCEMKDNIIYYTIDLSKFIKPIILENYREFSGIILDSTIKNIFTIQLGSIYDLVAFDEVFDDIDSIVSDDIPIYDMELLVRYVGVTTDCPNPGMIYNFISNTSSLFSMKRTEYQYVKIWKSFQGTFLSGSITRSNFSINCDATITNLILYSNKLNKIKSLAVQTNGKDYETAKNLKQYKTLYEYNNNTILNDNIFIYEYTNPINGYVHLNLYGDSDEEIDFIVLHDMNIIHEHSLW